MRISNLKIPVIVILSLWSSGLMGQELIKFADYLDNNGTTDSVLVEQSGGSSAAYYRIDYIFNGSKKITIDAEYDFSSFFCIIPVPDEVIPGKSSFLRNFCKRLFNVELVDSVGTPLKWYKEIQINKKTGKGNKITDFESTFELTWSSGNFDVSRAYATVVNKEFIEKMGSWIENPGVKQGRKYFNRYIVVYFGNNQKNLVCEDPLPDYNSISLCRTNHSVLLKKDGRYAFVFINDLNMLGAGSEKLRWNSLTGARITGNYLLIKTNSNTSEIDNLYIIDLVSNKIARLSYDYFNRNTIDDYSINDRQLLVNFGDKKIKIPIDDIFRKVNRN